MTLPHVLTPSAAALAALAFWSDAALAVDNRITWKSAGAHFEIAGNQVWTVTNTPQGAKSRSFSFTALRFHLGYYELRLVDVTELARIEKKRIARDQNDEGSSIALLELGVRTVFKTNIFESRIVAVGPAGFPTSSRDAANLGLLKIGGVERSKLLERGPTAVLCLDLPPGPNFQYQVPTFFRTANLNERHSVERCRDAVQVGPRILEDPFSVNRREFDLDTDKYGTRTYKHMVGGKLESETIYLGIPERSASRSPFKRAVLAVDDPGRIGERKSRDVARNVYLVVTATPATLWDVQDMLVNPQFYANVKYAPHWAVNLPGEDYASLTYATSDGVPAEIGAVDLRQASALVVLERK